MPENELPSFNAKAIAQISVDRLFGNRTYVIPTPDVDPRRTASLMLLYGDNGSGKTTLLRMLYSLLSPSKGGGFKSFLAATPFASFSVSLNDGTTFAAVRPGGELIGGFDLSLTYQNGEVISLPLRADSENKIKAQPDEQERAYKTFLSRVQDLGIALYYLSDDRRLQILHRPDTGSDAEENLPIRYTASRRIIHESDHLRALTERFVLPERESRGVSLEPSIDAFETWTRQHALRASNLGEGNTNTIYADLIRRITSAYGPQIEPADQNELEILRRRLVTIAERSPSFVELGLISQPPVDELVSEISRVDERSQPIVSSVLAPYI
jgi:energy-coupling factor transporter ATP-binding protein EcfA2